MQVSSWVITACPWSQIIICIDLINLKEKGCRDVGGLFLLPKFSVIAKTFTFSLFDYSVTECSQCKDFSVLFSRALASQTTYNPYKPYKRWYKKTGGINGGKVQEIWRYKYKKSGGIVVQELN